MVRVTSSAVSKVNAPAWVARASWVLVAVIGGTAVEAAVDDRSSAVRWVASVGGWAAWGAVMAALTIPAVRSLTVTRVIAPLSLVAAAVIAVAGAPALDLALLVIPSVVACAAMFTAPFGRQFVLASSYGDE